MQRGSFAFMRQTPVPRTLQPERQPAGHCTAQPGCSLSPLSVVSDPQNVTATATDESFRPRRVALLNAYSGDAV